MSDIQTEAEAGAKLAVKPFFAEMNGVPFLLTPSNEGAWKSEAYPQLLPAPLRKKGTINIHEVDSFIAFSKAQGSLSNTNIYLDIDYANQNIKATAIFNDDGDKDAGWKDHKAVFTPRLSEEWLRWNGTNKKSMEQESFASFLQDNIGDINAGGNAKMPSGSDVLTFVSKLEETRTVKYGTAVNLQNGMVQLEYTEEGDDHTKGKLDMFKEFGLGIRPFFGGEPYSIAAYLRYRIDRNTRVIRFSFELQRPDRVLEAACQELITKIKTETGFTVIFGNAP